MGVTHLGFQKVDSPSRWPYNMGLYEKFTLRLRTTLPQKELSVSSSSAKTTSAAAVDEMDASRDQTAAAEPLPALAPPLRADSPLGDAVRAFDEYMTRKGFSDNTIKAFRNDLKILLTFMEPSTKLLHITHAHIEEFLQWMQSERGRPCSAKTLARRITTLKVFFGWLHSTNVIGTDPAEPVVQQSVRTPLPKILTDKEVASLQRTAQDSLFDSESADARPFVLVSLLLQTGIKKAECARLAVADVDVSNPQSPEVAVRYEDERYAHKNRRLPLNPNFVSAFEEYLAQYKPEGVLFDCTPRNLEYVLDEVGQKARVRSAQVGFETLRWTSAVRDFRTGMPEEQLRKKMGLTKISWRETREKIYKLAGRGSL